jgi:hypothetical protein
MFTFNDEPWGNFPLVRLRTALSALDCTKCKARIEKGDKVLAKNGATPIHAVCPKVRREPHADL